MGDPAREDGARRGLSVLVPVAGLLRGRVALVEVPQVGAAGGVGEGAEETPGQPLESLALLVAQLPPIEQQAVADDGEREQMRTADSRGRGVTGRAGHGTLRGSGLGANRQVRWCRHGVHVRRGSLGALHLCRNREGPAASSAKAELTGP